MPSANYYTPPQLRPPGGAPAKFIKMVDPETSRELNTKIARNYLMYSRWYTDPEEK